MKHYGLRYFAGCLMMCAALLLTACGKEHVPDGGDPGETGSPAHAAQKPEWVFVPERIEIQDKRADYDAVQLVGDTACYLSMNGEAQGEPQNICQYSLADRKPKTIPIDWKDDGSIREISCYTFDDSGNIWLIANVYSAGFSNFRRFLYQFDPEGGNLLFRDISEQLGSGTSVERMAVDGQGRIYVFNPEQGIYLYAGDGSYHGAISYGSLKNIRARGAVDGNDGKFYVCIEKGEDADHCILAEVDFEKKQLTESIRDLPAVNGICKDSTGKYDFLLYDDMAAYGYRMAKQEAEELFLWGDSDINGYYVKYMSVLEDGRYFCAVEDWTYDDRSIVLLAKTKAEDVPERLDLILAAVDGGSELAGMAARFNRDSNQYHITVKNYASLADLYIAILAKESIDLIDLYGINVENLARQGVFEDLAPYLEQSETFEPSDFLEGILDVYSFGGMLVGIPEKFILRTVVGDKSLFGDEGRLTLDGLLAAAEGSPGTYPFDAIARDIITREEMMQYIMLFNEDVFIDWGTGECRFDSEQFKDLLEFCRRLPGSATGNDPGVYAAEASVSWNEILSERARNGQVLFVIANMWTFKEFRSYVKIFGENTACVGFPTADGRGGTLLFPENAFGIAAVSANKSGAWAFIESVLGQTEERVESSELYFDAYYSGRFPARKDILDAMIEEEAENDRWNLAKGRLPSVVYENGWKLTGGTITRDEINVIMDLIKEAKPFYAVEEDAVFQIIHEEAEAYYSGQKRIEDVITIIQNRTQVYVDENMINF